MAVKVEDIGKNINAYGNSVNINEPLTYFKNDVVINKWNKYKPYSNSAKFLDLSTDPSPVGQIWGMKYPIAQASDGLNLNKVYINHSMGAAAYPNWVYQYINDGDPRRLGDLKEYTPAAEIPFRMDVQNYTSSVNLFDSSSIRLVMYKYNINNYFSSLGEFFQKLDNNYFFVAELYEYNSQIPVYGHENWNYKYKSETPLKTAGSELYIDVDVSKFENKTFEILMGIQKYESGQYQPQSAIMPPREMTGYYRKISFFTLFNRSVSNGYSAYSPIESTSPWRAASTASSNPVSMNGSANLYIKFDIQKNGVPVYVIGPGFNMNNIPSGSRTIMFKVQTVGEGYNNNNQEVGTPIDPTTRQNMANGYALINSGSGVQTVGLNFANLIKAYGKIIYVMFFYSTDGGNTWSSNPMSYSMNIHITRGT
ncbi:hypothetical protein [uncultured Bacteroides sp.]|uniref:hypothetical protein n=1 Tax=uncultured Bacteroides sp. TaxID=162156 RepID=UPI0026125F8B|nr:hypothetical protein [uncultured Bacteroides sp.]